jgi:RNA polymerase sigma factor (sigma-70 family)
MNVQLQQDLWQQYFASGKPESIRNELVEAHRELLFYIAQRLLWQFRKADYADVISGVGSGMMKAVQAWDPERRPFAPWAFYCCRNAVKDVLRQTAFRTRGEWEKKRAGGFAAGQFPFTDMDARRNGDPSCPSDVPEENVRMRKTYHKGFDEVDDADAVAFALSKVSPREREVIRLQDFEGVLQDEIGRRIGRSGPRACQIRTGALAAMRVALTSQRGFTPKAAARSAA